MNKREEEKNTVDICLSPKKAFRLLISAIVGLTLLSLLLNLIRINTGRETLLGLMRLLDLNTEANLPTIYSVIQLLAVSIFCMFIGAGSKRSGNRYVLWFGLSAIFLYLGFDEGAGIHEMAQEWVRPLLNPSGAFTHVWVVSYGILFFIIALIYFRFWLHLDKRTRVLMAIAGAIYIGGAIGWEMAGAVHWSSDGDNRGLGMMLMYTAEEFMEMIGIAVFLYALFLYMQLNSIVVRVCCHNETRI